MKIRRRKLEAGTPYLPMADIAFNLVLFFIMLAKTQDTKHLEWEAARVPQVESHQQARVTVTVPKPTEKGETQVYLNGTQVSVADPKKMAEQVKDVLGDKPVGQRTVLL